MKLRLLWRRRPSDQTIIFQVRLSPQNVLGIKQFAATVGSMSLVKSSDKFLQKHFKAVSESEEFLGAAFDEVQARVILKYSNYYDHR